MVKFGYIIYNIILNNIIRCNNYFKFKINRIPLFNFISTFYFIAMAFTLNATYCRIYSNSGNISPIFLNDMCNIYYMYVLNLKYIL